MLDNATILTQWTVDSPVAPLSSYYSDIYFRVSHFYCFLDKITHVEVDTEK